MGNFAKRSIPQKPITMNCAMTEKIFKRRDGSNGNCYHFSFKDGNKNYSIDIVPGRDGKTTNKGREIIGWAKVAQFIDGGNMNW